VFAQGVTEFSYINNSYTARTNLATARGRGGYGGNNVVGVTMAGQSTGGPAVASCEKNQYNNRTSATTTSIGTTTANVMGAMSSVSQGKVVIQGGHNGTNVINTANIFNLATDAVSVSAAGASFSVMEYRSFGQNDVTGWAEGGYNGTSRSAAAESYAFAADTATAQTSLTTATSEATNFSNAPFHWMCGGCQGTSTIVATSQVRNQYNFSQGAATSLGQARGDSGSTGNSVNGYIFGGDTSGSFSNVATTEYYTMDTGARDGIVSLGSANAYFSALTSAPGWVRWEFNQNAPALNALSNSYYGPGSNNGGTWSLSAATVSDRVAHNTEVVTNRSTLTSAVQGYYSTPVNHIFGVLASGYNTSTPTLVNNCNKVTWATESSASTTALDTAVNGSTATGNAGLSFIMGGTTTAAPSGSISSGRTYNFSTDAVAVSVATLNSARHAMAPVPFFDRGLNCGGTDSGSTALSAVDSVNYASVLRTAANSLTSTYGTPCGGSNDVVGFSTYNNSNNSFNALVASTGAVLASGSLTTTLTQQGTSSNENRLYFHGGGDGVNVYTLGFAVQFGTQAASTAAYLTSGRRVALGFSTRPGHLQALTGVRYFTHKQMEGGSTIFMGGCNAGTSVSDCNTVQNATGAAAQSNKLTGSAKSFLTGAEGVDIAHATGGGNSSGAAFDSLSREGVMHIFPSQTMLSAATLANPGAAASGVGNASLSAIVSGYSSAAGGIPTTNVQLVSLSNLAYATLTLTTATQRWSGVGVNGDTKGYLMGGMGNAATRASATTGVQSFTFANWVFASLTALSNAKSSNAGWSSPTQAYGAAGLSTASAALADVEKFAVSNDAKTSATSWGTATGNEATGSGNPVYGMTLQNASALNYDVVQKHDYAADTYSSTFRLGYTNSLGGKRGFSSVPGWYVAGKLISDTAFNHYMLNVIGGTASDDMQFSNEAFSSGVSLHTSFSSGCAHGNLQFGMALAGLTGGSTITISTDTINYSGKSVMSQVNVLTGRYQVGGWSTRSRGWLVSGRTGFGTSTYTTNVEIVHYPDMLLYSAATLTTGRAANACYSSVANGYAEAGYNANSVSLTSIEKMVLQTGAVSTLAAVTSTQASAQTSVNGSTAAYSFGGSATTGDNAATVPTTRAQKFTLASDTMASLSALAAAAAGPPVGGAVNGASTGYTADGTAATYLKVNLSNDTLSRTATSTVSARTGGAYVLSTSPVHL
jgi:hypothetical protein